MSVSIMYRQKIDFSSCAWMVGFPKFGHICVCVTLKGYNDYVAKKIKKPRLSAEGLKIHIDALSDLRTFPSVVFIVNV